MRIVCISLRILKLPHVVCMLVIYAILSSTRNKQAKSIRANARNKLETDCLEGRDLTN